MKHDFCALRVMTFVTAMAFSVVAEEARKPGTENTRTVDVVDSNGNVVNSYIEKWCAPSDDPCGCRAHVGGTPQNDCVHLNIDLGRTRYSALTETIRLQFNELSPNSALYSPAGFRVVAGYAIRSVSRDKNPDGAPQFVTLTSPAGVSLSFKFGSDASVAKPVSPLGSQVDDRLAMVDAQGWATASDPAFYDYYTGDGSRWRFGAAKSSPDYMQLVEHQTPEGRVETQRDLGLEIIKDGAGQLRQVVTPAWIANFLIVGQDAHDLRIYPNDTLSTTGTRTADGCYEIAGGAVPDVVWEFRNPNPGVMKDLLVTQKRGAVSQTWRYEYKEAVRDFTLMSPDNLKEERLEQFFSDDGSKKVVRRSIIASDGRVVSVSEKRFLKDPATGDSRLVCSVRDPDGLRLTSTFEYYGGGTADGLPSLTAYEDGSWLRHEYDAQGRETAQIRPWLDAATNAPLAMCAVTRYGYAFVDAADFLRGGDQRPRTEINEICGIEVSRTYHAYPTNALGQAQEIEERAAFPGAPYGHASNPRTVKTYYAASAEIPLPGRLASVVYPGGKTETYGYEYGTFNAATLVFTPDPDGGAWRETVTTEYADDGRAVSPKPPTVQALRSARVWDEKGREVLDESYVGDGASFALIGWKRFSYDMNGKPVETAYSDGRLESATWGANCCGKESETATDGTIMVYSYNLLKQKASETKKGFAADGSDDISTLYTYDLENRLLSTAVTNTASGLGYVATRNAYDAVGRLTNSFDRLGNATIYSYSGTGDLRLAPNGITTITERYLDGQTKCMVENGVVKQSYAYGVSPDNTRWTLSAQGELPATIQSTLEITNVSTLELLDFPWSISVTDLIGRSVSTHKPGFGGTVLVTSNAYDIAGNLLFSAQFSVYSNNPIYPVILSKNIYSYVADGSRLFTALDLNTNGVIDLSGPDRVTGSSAAYERDNSNVWWRVSRSWVYPEFGSAHAVTTSVRRVKLTGLGVPQGGDGILTSLSESVDVCGNVTSASMQVNRAARKLARVTAFPTSIQPAIKTTVNGLLIRAVSSTAVTNTFGYDSLGRRIAATDGRGNTTITGYNTLGLITWEENAASNLTSYAYDALGRRTVVTDALGNVIHTSYDADGRTVKLWGAKYPVEYGYDGQGRMVSMKTFRDENTMGEETRWLYDNPSGLLTNKLYADGEGPSYGYAADGKLISRLWARGISTFFAYSLDGSLIGVDYSDATPDVSYTVNRLGQQLSAISSVSTNVLTYSRVTLELISETQNGTLITRANDVTGRASGLSLEDDYGVVYLYDENGRINNLVSRHGAFVSTNTYVYVSGSDLLAGLSAGPLMVTKTYEPNRDLIAQVRNATDAGVVSQYDYSNDVIGRRVTRNDSGVAFTQSQDNAFGYNLRSEVISAVMHTNVYGYLYDSIGNRVAATYNSESNNYVSNPLNQYVYLSNRVSIVSSCDGLITYDLDGNITSCKGWHYSWNAENRLSMASNDTYVMTYAYDSRGRMVSKCTYRTSDPGLPISDRRMLWDNYNTIRETTIVYGSTLTTNVAHYIWGLDLSGSFPDAGGVGGLLSVSSMKPEQPDSMDIWYPSYDANGNITEYLSGDGSIASHREYDAFGMTTFCTGQNIKFTYWFSTKPWCEITGFSEYEFRMYDSDLGRWLSRDPLNEQGGVNLYVHTLNMCVNKYDFLGLELRPRLDITKRQHSLTLLSRNPIDWIPFTGNAAVIKAIYDAISTGLDLIGSEVWNYVYTKDYPKCYIEDEKARKRDVSLDVWEPYGFQFFNGLSAVSIQVTYLITITYTWIPDPKDPCCE